MARRPEFFDMTAGDDLIFEIMKTCSGYEQKINLAIANQLLNYTVCTGEHLTFGEFVEACQPRGL